MKKLVGSNLGNNDTLDGSRLKKMVHSINGGEKIYIGGIQRQPNGPCSYIIMLIKEVQRQKPAEYKLRDS